MNAKANTAAVEDDIKLLLDTLWNSHLKSSMKIKKSSVMISIKFWDQPCFLISRWLICPTLQKLDVRLHHIAQSDSRPDRHISTWCWVKHLWRLLLCCILFFELTVFDFQRVWPFSKQKRRMAATRRLQKELGDLRKAAGKSFRDIQVCDCQLSNKSVARCMSLKALNHVAVIPVKPETPQVDESNLLVWQGLLVPDAVPYNKVAITNFPPLSTWLHFLNESCLLQGAFLIDIVFPAEYPFKPPKVTIYKKKHRHRQNVTSHHFMSFPFTSLSVHTSLALINWMAERGNLGNTRFFL